MGLDTTLTSAPNFSDLEIVKTGTAEVSAVGGTITTETIPHNLGYVPVAFVSLGDGTYSFPLPTATTYGVDVPNIVTTFAVYWFHGVDETNLYITGINAAAGDPQTYPFTYTLLRTRSKGTA